MTDDITSVQVFSWNTPRKGVVVDGRWHELAVDIMRVALEEVDIIKDKSSKLYESEATLIGTRAGVKYQRADGGTDVLKIHGRAGVSINDSPAASISDEDVMRIDELIQYAESQSEED